MSEGSGGRMVVGICVAVGIVIVGVLFFFIIGCISMSKCFSVLNECYNKGSERSY